MDLQRVNPWIPAFKVCIRCTQLGPVTSFKTKQNEDNKYFKGVIMDKLMTEMNITAWGDEADRFHLLLKENDCFLLINGRIKQQDQKYAGGILNVNCMELDHSTSIELIIDDGSIPLQRNLHFSQISGFGGLKKDDYVNVIALISNIGPKRQLASRYKQKPRFIRTLQIRDQTGI